VITARATGEDGTQLIVLGVARENIERLVQGQPIRVDAAHHPGFPEKLRVVIFFGETRDDLAKALEPFIGADTKVIPVAPEKGRAT
jgi:hypothetical protein